MGFFNLFKKPLKIHDKVFGNLVYTRFNDGSKNFYSGQVYFNEHHPKVGVVIDTDEPGPTEEQYQFYKDLQASYSSLANKIIPLLTGEFRNWKEDFVITDFNKEFTIEGITIPRMDVDPLSWDISFATIHDHHFFTVVFAGQEPQFVGVDG